MGHALNEHLYRRLVWEDLSEDFLLNLIQFARSEDLLGGGLAKKSHYQGDLTSVLFEKKRGSACLLAKQDITICGLGLIPLILKSYDDSVAFNTLVQDGEILAKGGIVCELEGNASSLLQVERVLLNFIQHLSGIATMTRRFVRAMGETDTKLLDTRKTIPGYRLLEKYAVACGGGWNHRLGLFDRILFKDNHWAIGSGESYRDLPTLVQWFRKQYPDVVVEIEVDHLDQVSEVIDAAADVILLDNFSFADIETAIKHIQGRVLTEASGNVSLETVGKLSMLGLDFISCGAITHQSQWVDIGMDWMD